MFDRSGTAGSSERTLDPAVRGWRAVGGPRAALRAAVRASAVVLVALGLGLHSETAPARPQPEAVTEPCALCRDDLQVPVVPLRTVWLDSLAREIATRNEAQIGRIDARLQAGEFGDAASGQARAKAHLLARLTTQNAYRYLFEYATATDRVYEADEATFASIFATYTDPSLFAIARLQRARFGLGTVCMHYDLDTPMRQARYTTLGAKHMQYRIGEEKLGGRKRRVLSFDLPTGQNELVEVLVEQHYMCKVEYVRLEGPPSPHEVFLVHDIEGGWLRKWGTHHPTAFMFWVSPQLPPAETLPEEPLVGVRIYIPNLRLRLPLFLPDINFDDLRQIELPQPIVTMSYLQSGRTPDWLGIGSQYLFREWSGYGPVPPVLRQRFPDR